MQPMKPKPGKPINEVAEKLDALNESIRAMGAEREKALTEIRNSAHDAVVVFVDMVGSTQSKADHKNEPEVWMYKVRQFYAVVSAYVGQLGGRVVKCIGDEVMAVFDGDTLYNDSANFITRIGEIEQGLRDATGEATGLKVAVDSGKVYCIKLPGHDELDVLGTTVDRCARIAKYTKPSTVLASFDYRKACSAAYNWTLVGEPTLKGIGKTKVFQLGDKTVEIAEMVEIPATEMDALRRQVDEKQAEIEALAVENQEVKGMNMRLQNRIEQMGERVGREDRAKGEANSTEAEEAWSEIEKKMQELVEAIKKAPVPTNQYARFLFLYMQDSGETYNRYEGKVFDECIEEKLVTKSDGFYSIDPENRRNKKIIWMMEELRQMLNRYEEKYRDADSDSQDDEELYAYNLVSPEFWEEKVGISVRYW
jgi:class 3 adenylate cyclase